MDRIDADDGGESSGISLYQVANIHQLVTDPSVDWLRSAGILRNARVGTVHFAALFVHNEFLQYRFGLCLTDRGRTGGASVGLDDPKLWVSFDESFVYEAKFADPLRSELNPLSEPGRDAGAPGLQLVVVV
jgi:hypothetical protein